MLIGGPRRIEVADPIIDQVVLNGFVIDGADQTEPDFSGVNLFEEMLHTLPEERDADFEELIDNYIENVQALALLAHTAAEGRLGIDSMADPLARSLGQFAIARQTGSIIAQHQTTRSLHYIQGWFTDYYRQPERLATFPFPSDYGERAAKEYELRFLADEHLARIPGQPLTQSPTEVMNWRLGLTLTKLVDDCDQMITDARNQ